MRYIVITLSNGYCGCDEEYCLMFPKEITDENITAYACELFNEYVENFCNPPDPPQCSTWNTMGAGL